jgi:hypothetical protein
MGPLFGTLIWGLIIIWGVIWDPYLGGDMGPTFRTPILELMPNVISKIKQNYSDMNKIILAPCDAGYVQSCTGFLVTTHHIKRVFKFQNDQDR